MNLSKELNSQSENYQTLVRITFYLVWFILFICFKQRNTKLRLSIQKIEIQGSTALKSLLSLLAVSGLKHIFMLWISKRWWCISSIPLYKKFRKMTMTNCWLKKWLSNTIYRVPEIALYNQKNYNEKEELFCGKTLKLNSVLWRD